MPGTIVVSVIELVDLPSSPSPSTSLCLKVSMGKREHETTGQAKFSFPLASLRDNLVVILHDSVGNEISRAEFRTMVLVEKGIWDELFPLEGGGCVRMKLEFLLSQEERKRIQEMREFARRKKRVELVNGPWSSTFGKIVDGVNGNSFKELDIGRVNILELEQTNPDEEGPPLGKVSFQEHVQPQDNSHEDAHGLNEENNVSLKSQSVLDHLHQQYVPSEKSSDSRGGYSRSINIKHLTQNRSSTSAYADKQINDISREKKSPERVLRSNVRNMISAFENSLSQRKTEVSLRKTAMEISKMRACLEESDIDKGKVPISLAKSFSAGMLSDMGTEDCQAFLKLPLEKKQEELKIFDHASFSKREIKLSRNTKAELKQNVKNDLPGKLDDVETDGDRSIREFTPVAQTDILKDKFKVDEHNKSRDADCFLESGKNESTDCSSAESKKCHPIASKNRSQKKVGERTLSPENRGSWVVNKESSACRTSSSISSFSSEREEVLSNYSINRNNQRDDIRSDSVEEKERNKHDNIPQEADCSTEISGEQSDKACEDVTVKMGCYGSTSKTIIGSTTTVLRETTEFLSPSCNCIHLSVNTWIPRHLCVTTGSRQLKELVGRCSPCVEDSTTCVEDSTKENRITNIKDRLLRDGRTGVESDDKVRCETESSDTQEKTGISNLTVTLFEQGARIVVVIVACLTLLSSGQR